MINQKLFATWMGILSDRMNRALHPATQRAYYAILSAELSSEEFEAAAALALRDATFWPSPKELIDFVQPRSSLELAARREFSEIIAKGEPIVSGNGTIVMYRPLTPAGEEAWRLMGGSERIRHVEHRDLHWARKEFVDAYVSIAADLQLSARATKALARAPLALTSGTNA